MNDRAPAGWLLCQLYILEVVKIYYKNGHIAFIYPLLIKKEKDISNKIK